MSLGTIKRIKTICAIFVALWLSSVASTEFFYTNSAIAKYASIRDYLAFRTPLIQSSVERLISQITMRKPIDTPPTYTAPTYSYTGQNTGKNIDIAQAVTLKKRGGPSMTAVELDTIRQLDTNYRITEVTTPRGLVEVVSPLQSQVPTADLQVLGKINDLLEERGM